MPELPEVESIKRAIKQNVIGKVIADIEILSPKNFVGNPDAVLNKKIVEVSRFGKVLVIALNNKKYLNVHFKLSGQMLYANKFDNAVFKNIIPFTGGHKMPANTTRVIIKFKDDSAIFFNDLRKFGWIKVSSAPLAPKGVDVLDDNFTVKYLLKIFKKTRRPIKVALMDQDIITGIGNIYANDSLYLAKIHPLRPTNSLIEKEIKVLHKMIIQEIKKGIKDKGSSGADEAFILPDGSRGQHQRHFLVYDQEKKPCRTCGTNIKRLKHNGRSSYFCPNCQK